MLSIGSQRSIFETRCILSVSQYVSGIMWRKVFQKDLIMKSYLTDIPETYMSETDRIQRGFRKYYVDYLWKA